MTARASIPGYGLCGCENPRFHQRGCLWGLDRRRPRRARTKPAKVRLAPRNGCCVICGEFLDVAAIGASDSRCTPCYRAMFAKRRANILGGDR